MLRSVTKNLLRQTYTQRSLSATRKLSAGEVKYHKAAGQPDTEIIGGWHFPSDPPSSIVQNSPFEPINVRNMSVDQFVWEDLHKWPNHTAVICGITGRSYTYSQLRDRCAAFAIQLQTKFGLQKGDVMGLSLPNAPEFAVASLGAIEAGLIITTVNPLYNAEETARQLIHSNAKILIGAMANYATLSEAVRLSKKPIKIICVRLDSNEQLPAGAIDFTELMNPNGIDYSLLTHHEIGGDDVVFLPFSSGTTGMPKGVMLTHNNIVSNSDMVQVDSGDGSVAYPTTLTHQDVLPLILPLFHIYGWTVTLVAKLRIGVKLVSLPKFQPDTFLKCLEEHKTTVLKVVPPIVIFMANSENLSKKHTDSMRAIQSGAAPMGKEDADRFLKKAPHVKFCQGYGLTETSPCVLFGVLGDDKYDAVGFPTPTTQVKVCAVNDPTFTGLGPNQSGEILVRGPQIMKGYLNNLKATNETIIENGWLRSGDIGFYDAKDGQFRITDRLKELIKVKGYQVPPAELEVVLRDHPEILDAGVVGIPHPTHGEVPRAFVVVKPGSSVTEKDIEAYVAKKVTSYKQLTGGVMFLDAIPKNPTGKIMRRVLKETYC